MTVLAEKTAVVTGAAQGIGRAIAEALVRHGARVLLADVNVESAERAATELNDDDQRAIGVLLDVREEDSFRTAFDHGRERFGRIDILVNNAARTAATPIWEITQDEWDDVLATNLRGVFFGCRVAGQRMQDGKGGRIINLASLAGEWGRSPTGIHYAASKAGIIGVTRVFANALAREGVTVNAVAPATIDGPQVQAMPAEQISRYVDQNVPVGRLGRPAEVAELIAFMASDAAGFITGATFDVNGGALMR